ncbi:MAG: hypothetical protein SOR58_03235 [Megasphaera massiliensis]|uniref:DUF6414 family protein n=1 Tax=Megasphaera massiliensis TaxID=1232428 RepID=UPI002A747A03|nr:hypothetical protein [Megasphaera massiliensis]MDY2965195.1 hypothetical protein [Megasphaera massiliensis]
MGQENKTRSELSESSSLIDFLYVDNDRVDSLISQLRNGTLRSVTKTLGTSEGSAISGKGTIEVISGQYSSKNKSKEEASEQYDPYHSRLITLLNDLRIPPLEELPPLCDSRLACIQASIKIRDLRSIKTLFPFVEKNFKIFNLQNDKGTRESLKLVSSMVQSMDDSIQLSIQFDSNLISGTLREGCLSVRQSDLNRIYGVSLPGQWYVLGILDSQPQPQFQPIDNIANGSIEYAIDAYTDAINQIYSHSQYGIIPILIYREITY